MRVRELALEAVVEVLPLALTGSPNGMKAASQITAPAASVISRGRPIWSVWM